MSTPHTVIQDVRFVVRMVTVFLVAVALVGISAGPARLAARSANIELTIVLDPTTAPMLSGTSQVINNGPGEQTDPGIDCDLAPYTNDDNQGSQTIRYFNFVTNTDQLVPGNGLDSISDVLGPIITFTEGGPPGAVIVLFNTATQSRTVVPGFQNSHSVLGGTLVVYENRSFSPAPNESEISVFDQSTNTVSRLTDDLLFDRNPAVSPTGNAVVWEKCQNDGLGCDIYSAIQMAPGLFSTTALTGVAGEDRQPQTNGQIAVYTSNRNGESDMYFQPVGGGVETRLSVPGDQRDVSIAGNLISFQSTVPPNNNQFDVFVYDISTSLLYRVTNTPVNETLNEITKCNGVARVVYAAPAMDFNIFAFTFQLPSSARKQIEDLIELVESFNLPHGTENSLLTKLEDAIAAIEASDIVTACDLLSAFINECQAQSGKKLTTAQASQLTSSATRITTDLGCQ